MTISHKVLCTIRTYRESRGYSQDYMAEMLNICQSAYANLEAGKTSLSIERLYRIADILETNVHHLIEPELVPVKDHQLHHHSQYDTMKVYDQLISELKNEIDFLRNLVRENRSELDCAPVPHSPQRHDHA